MMILFRMADKPKRESCRNCAKRNECQRKKVAIWCIWYKPENYDNKSEREK